MRLTDLGIARIWRPENNSDTSGTPGYMGKFMVNLAPEVMCKLNHGVASDYFAVGVIAYECMFGKVINHFLYERDHIQVAVDKK